jgi:hypothetical protein
MADFTKIKKKIKVAPVPKIISELVLSVEEALAGQGERMDALEEQQKGFDEDGDGVIDNALRINGLKLTVGVTPPENPQVHDLWLDIS